MRGAERVILALRAFGEARKSAALTERAHAIATPRQNLVRICLVPDIPDQAIAGRVKNVMQRDGQFDDTEAGAKMTTRDRDDVDSFLPQLVSKLTQLILGKGPQICGLSNLVQQGRA